MQMYLKELGIIGMEFTKIDELLLNFINVLWMRAKTHF
jgi:hypothetical protein